MKKLTIIFIALVVLLLAACSSPTSVPSPPTMDYTQVVDSVNATLTAEGPQATPTPEPTATQEPTPTNTPEPSPTPTLVPVQGDPASILGEPDGRDSFNSDSNWTLFNNQCFRSEIADGRYIMESKGLQGVACWEVSWPLIQDYYMESQVFMPEQCHPDDRFFMVFRAPDNNRGYIYGLTCDGQFSLTMWDGNASTVIVPPARTEAIRTEPGVMNRLGVIAYGGDYMLYANGTLVAQAQDFTYTEPGKIGYHVRAATDQGFVVSYDNLAVWLLQDDFIPPSAPPPPNSGEIPPPASGVPTVTTITWVNVRSGPGLQFPIYFVAPPGSTAEAVGISVDGQWYAIKVPTTVSGTGTAWVAADYVIPQNTAGLSIMTAPLPPPGVEFPPPEAQVPTVTNFEPLNVRAGPGNQFPSYGVAPRGSTAPVIGISEDGQWYVVVVPTSVAPDGTGWVNANYVVLDNPSGVDIPVISSPEELPPIAPPPPAEGAPTVTTTDAVNARTGPDNICESYGVSPIGASAEVIGVNMEGTWFEVVLPSGISPTGSGWVNGNYVVLSNPAGVNIPVTQSEICP